FKSPADRTSFVDATNYTTPTVRTQAEADQKGLVQLPKEDATAFRQGNLLADKIQRLDRSYQAVLADHPQLQALANDTGMDTRAKNAAIVSYLSLNQSDPRLKQFTADLQEVNISYGRFVSGLQSRPAASILEKTTENLPSTTTSLFNIKGGNWLQTAASLLLGGKVADNPLTITTQLRLMNDAVKSVQESHLVSAGALTPEEAAQRQETRRQAIR